jgi:dolichyl-phosphate beta-glucosyltransferase
LSYRPNRGKGHAVRVGMLAATGQRRLFTDADLSTPIEELSALMAALDAGADIAIGSRRIDPERVERAQPAHRRLLGAGFNQLVRLAGLREFRDTQCGVKLFSAAAASDLFGRATVDGFAFDVEILHLAAGRYQVAEVAVRWSHDDDSRLLLGRTTLRMAYDLVRIRAGMTGRSGNGRG